MQKITPFIWFNDQADEAMNLYVKVFKNAKIVTVARSGDRVQSGTVELDGFQLHCFNGGPLYKPNEGTFHVRAFGLML